MIHLRLENHLRPCTLCPIQHETDEGLPYSAFYLRFETFMSARSAGAKLKAALDLWGMHYEIMHLSAGRKSDYHVISICSTNPLVPAVVELLDWHEGELIKDIPALLHVEGGVPALRYQPGMN